MRHRDARQRLTQKPGHARMLKRNLVTSLLLYEQVRTTKSRARAIQPIIDRLLRTAKKSEPHVAIRAINKVVTDKNACRKVIEVLKARYATRDSGLTRIRALGSRLGDNAELVEITLVDAVIGGEAPPVKERKPAATKAEKKVEKKDTNQMDSSPATAVKKPAAKKPSKTATAKKQS